MRLRCVAVQLAQEQTSLEAGFSLEREHAPHWVSLVFATSLTVAAVLGFSRQYRLAMFLQRCLFKHLRRYLVVLGCARWNLCFRGGVPQLRFY